jgi:hypothetical protein
MPGPVKRRKTALARFLDARIPSVAPPVASSPAPATPANVAASGSRAPTAKVAVPPEPAPGAVSGKKPRHRARPGDPIQVVRHSRLDPFLDRIGVLPDEEVARLAGVSSSNVRQYRSRRRIPAPSLRRRSTTLPLFERMPAPPTRSAAPTPVAVPSPAPSGSGPASWPPMKIIRTSKMDPFLDMIGITPDAEVAELAGVTPENVRAYRKRRGIPARWRGAAGASPRKTGRGAAAPPVAPAAPVAPVVPVVPVVPVEAPLPVAPAVPVEAPVQLVPAALEAPAAAAGSALARPASHRSGFLVVLADDDEFVVLADDIGQAASFAVARLAARRPEARVVAIQFIADNLPE